MHGIFKVQAPARGCRLGEQPGALQPAPHSVYGSTRCAHLDLYSRSLLNLKQNAKSREAQTNTQLNS